MIFGKQTLFGRSSGGGTPGVALNLTALMDILSNLLFFLLAAYAAQATEVEDKSELHLPSSTSQVRLQLQLTISITRHAVQVADVPIVGVDKSRLSELVDADGKIPSLFNKLISLRERREKSDPNSATETNGILLLADKDTDSEVVSQVLKTAGYAGFINVRFGVIAR